MLKAVKLATDLTADLIWKPPLGASMLRARVARYGGQWRRALDPRHDHGDRALRAGLEGA